MSTFEKDYQKALAATGSEPKPDGPLVRAGARVYAIQSPARWKDWLPVTHTEDELFDLLKNFGKLVYTRHGDGTWYQAGMPLFRDVSATSLQVIRALPDLMENLRLYGKLTDTSKKDYRKALAAATKPKRKT